MRQGNGPMLARTAFFFWLLAFAGTANCWSSPRDAQAQGLAHYIMAVYHDVNGDARKAIDEYRLSVKYNAFEPAPRLKLGAYYLRLGLMPQAVNQLKAVLRTSPGESSAHYLLALVYSSQDKYDLAAAEYETLLKNASSNDPTNTDAYMYLAQLHYAQKKYPQAIQEFNQVLTLEPLNTTAMVYLGSVYADLHEDQKAVESFRRVLQIDPGDSEALNSLGYIYAQQNIHVDEAIAMIRQAIKIDPANGAYYDSLGWALYQKGAYSESLMALQKAQEFIEDPILYDHLGDVFKALKEYALAVQYWRKSLDLEGHQPLVQQKINGIQQCIASTLTHRPK